MKQKFVLSVGNDRIGSYDSFAEAEYRANEITEECRICAVWVKEATTAQAATEPAQNVAGNAPEAPTATTTTASPDTATSGADFAGNADANRELQAKIQAKNFALFVATGYIVIDRNAKGEALTFADGKSAHKYDINALYATWEYNKQATALYSF